MRRQAWLVATALLAACNNDVAVTAQPSKASSKTGTLKAALQQSADAASMAADPAPDEFAAELQAFLAANKTNSWQQLSPESLNAMNAMLAKASAHSQPLKTVPAEAQAKDKAAEQKFEAALLSAGDITPEAKAAIKAEIIGGK